MKEESVTRHRKREFCVCACLSMCMYVCARERDRGGERDMAEET